MLQVVVAQYQHRSFGAQASVQKRLADVLGGAQRLGKAQALPVSQAAFFAIFQTLALGEQRVLGPDVGPVHQPLAHRGGVGLQGLLGLHIAHARGPFAQHDVAHTEGHQAVFGGC